jgi:hypothetical protein
LQKAQQEDHSQWRIEEGSYLDMHGKFNHSSSSQQSHSWASEQNQMVSKKQKKSEALLVKKGSDIESRITKLQRKFVGKAAREYKQVEAQ